ncbi:Uncharacterised protein [Psychrobacter phenylpyruvicus]|uniref:Glycosyl transferase family 1 domain-containing protein n=1 Tax=Psychrobacter phenylpyruvicus TaxID=29432 RepID=A0A379LPH5_9GAMM|nr:Uncharacterised protein [Psychrobacter phenylpyruvicus]
MIVYESETKVFIYSGRITRSKKTFEMIRWFIGSQYIDNSILLILGEGEEMVKCTELAQDYKKVVFKILCHSPKLCKKQGMTPCKTLT